MTSPALQGPSPDLLRSILNPEFVRAAEVDGKLWLSAKDVCAEIGYSDVREACETLEQDDLSKLTMPTPHGPRTMRTITIDGAISLLLRGRKPQAREFQRWLVEYVRQALAAEALDLNTQIRL